MTSKNNETEWRVPVAVETIPPPTGLHMEIDASDEIRARIVKLAGLRDLPRLSAVFDLTRRGAGVHVSGTVSAVVGQTCVVTLEPLETQLEEPVDLLFTPQAAAERDDEEPVARRELGENDPPEPLIDGEVDLGKVATEFLILGIDPYPRKPDAQFAAPSDDTGRDNPFAALAALKKPPGGDKP